MKIQVNDTGFVESFALIGNLENAIEVVEPENMEHFLIHFAAYRFENDGLSFCPGEDNALKLLEQKNIIRERRDKECFSVINRGELWYARLTEEQTKALDSWYSEWLCATDTLTIPEKPSFL